MSLPSSVAIPGMKNADMLMSMNNLANVYSAQRRYAQAEALYQETLAAERGALGPENPLTLYALDMRSRILHSCTNVRVTIS